MLDRQLVEIAERLNAVANRLVDLERYLEADAALDIGDVLLGTADAVIDLELGL